jgi:hypothetical protein
MDVHFDGVRRMFIDHLGPEDIDRLVETWRTLQTLSPTMQNPAAPVRPGSLRRNHSPRVPPDQRRAYRS